jgi:arabinogalactan endo-1,4-beta-galactosidase
MYQVGGKEFDDWTAAQDAAVQLLNDGIEYVNILLWDDERKTWGLLQELNLERGIIDKNFNTHVLAPYYVTLRNL